MKASGHISVVPVYAPSCESCGKKNRCAKRDVLQVSVSADVAVYGNDEKAYSCCIETAINSTANAETSQLEA